MKLNHIALNIQSEEEAVDFYQDILGFHFEYKFDLSAEMAKDIFSINKVSKAFVYKKEDVVLELFVHADSEVKGFTHLCIEVKDREKIAVACEEKGYPVVRIKRTDKADLLFVKDKAGNVFELKKAKSNV